MNIIFMYNVVIITNKYHNKPLTKRDAYATLRVSFYKHKKEPNKQP